MLRVISILLVIQVATVDKRSQKGNIEYTERDTSGDFDKIGMGVVNKNCLEPVVQVGLEPGN